MIPDDKVSNAMNVIFESGRVKRRYGYSPLGANLPLSGPVLEICYYQLLRSNQAFTVVFTNRDAYYYDSGTGRFLLITKNYVTGSATAVDAVVTGAGTTWLPLVWTKLSIYKIKFGTNVLNTEEITKTGTTGSGSAVVTSVSNVTDLYPGLPVSGSGIPVGARIKSVDSASQITLSAPCTATATITMTFDVSYWYTVASVAAGTTINLTDFSSSSGATTNGSKVITGLSGTAALWPGMSVTGAGIAANSIIDTIDSASQVTLNNNATASATVPLDFNLKISTGVKYVLRLCFGGTAQDKFCTAQPYYTPDNEKILCVTNGVDPIMKWNGTGAFVDLGGSPNFAKYIGYFGSVGFEHFMSAWTNDGTYNLPQTVEISDAGDPESGLNTYYELLNNNDEIVGMKSLGTKVVVYKRNSITVGYPTPEGGNVDPFDWEQDKIKDVGAVSIRTVCDFGNFHIFLGQDNVYIFDGASVIPVAGDIALYFQSILNKPKITESFAFAMRDKRLYCLFIPTGTSDDPNLIFIYNYDEKHWTIWSLGFYGSGYGTVTKDYSPTWDDLIGTGELWPVMTMRAIDLLISAADVSYIFGDTSGYIWEFGSTFEDDNGTDIAATITTKDFPLNDPKHAFRLLETVSAFATRTGDLRIRASVDFGVSWSEWITIPMAGGVDYDEQIQNFLLRGRQVRFELENISGANFEFESLIVGFNNAGISR
jgi:hypothetical protein